MQGYDSVAVKADVELGGFDQLFNLKAGRIIQRHFGMPEQDVLTVQMLLGTDGRKMSTSWGNVINIIDTPSDMYGKVMSIKDELVKDYFLLATDISLEEIDTIYTNITHPKEIKQRLAREIVSMYHSKADALEAEKNFTQTFSEKGIPQDVSVIETNTDTLLVDVLLTHHVVSSKTEFRRLIDEGAIFHLEEHKKITNVQDVAHTGTYRIGKKRFIQISQKPL
jgi:tyrosyl-tRNA synthetase